MRKKDGLWCAAKIFKLNRTSMYKIDELGIERETEILKKVDHPFIIKHIDEFYTSK